MSKEIDVVVYVTRKDRYGNVDYIIKIPRPIAEQLGLKHKQKIRIRIVKHCP